MLQMLNPNLIIRYQGANIQIVPLEYLLKLKDNGLLVIFDDNGVPSFTTMTNDQDGYIRIVYPDYINKGSYKIKNVKKSEIDRLDFCIEIV